MSMKFYYSGFWKAVDGKKRHCVFVGVLQSQTTAIRASNQLDCNNKLLVASDGVKPAVWSHNSLEPSRETYFKASWRQQYNSITSAYG